MAWYAYVGYLFAGAFIANGLPHFLQGICGNKFQTPFARPSGVGESSAVVNVLWGWLNFVIGGALISYVFPFPGPGGLAVAALGALALALGTAAHFRRVRNGAPSP